MTIKLTSRKHLGILKYENPAVADLKYSIHVLDFSHEEPGIWGLDVGSSLDATPLPKFLGHIRQILLLLDYESWRKSINVTLVADYGICKQKDPSLPI